MTRGENSRQQRRLRSEMEEAVRTLVNRAAALEAAVAALKAERAEYAAIMKAERAEYAATVRTLTARLTALEANRGGRR